MCLAFHTKGTCNPNCRRKDDHVEYNTAEYLPLVEWCCEHFPTAWNFSKSNYTSFSFPPLNTIKQHLILQSSHNTQMPSSSKNNTIPSNNLTRSQLLASILPPRKKLRVPTSTLLTDLGEYIVRDASLVRSLGWSEFVKQRRQRSDFSNLNIKQPAKRLLKHYKHHGASIKFSTPPWPSKKLHEAISWGPHRSSNAHLEFLESEFADMINKGQWTILPYSLAKTLPGLRLSSPGVIPQHGRRPW